MAVDGVVLALGVNGLKSVMAGSPALAARSLQISKAASLGSIDCLSVRLWLDKKIPTRSPANVLSRFPGLRGAGATFFMLDQLQAETADILWGGPEMGINGHVWNGTPQRGSVVAADFYNSGGLMSLSDQGGLMSLSDQALADLLIKDLLPTAVPAFRNATVVEVAVARSPGAVAWFSPGSFSRRPELEVRGVENLVCAGDWVRLGRYETKAKGLCQERAWVSGLQAANALGRRRWFTGVPSSKEPPQVVVKEIRADEPQVRFGRVVNKQLMSGLKQLGWDSWWVV
eukprot:g19816.t1